MQFVSRAEWGARPPVYTNALNLSQVAKYIVHYSGADRSQTVRSIQNYSMDSKGYSDIDYSYVVKDGLVYVGRGDNTGGHTLGHNSSSYGVCVIGQDGDATHADFAAVKELHAYLSDHVGRTLTVLGHQDANPGQTDCPGSQIESWLKAGMPLGDNDMTEYTGENLWVAENRIDAMANLYDSYRGGWPPEIGKPVPFTVLLKGMDEKLDAMLAPEIDYDLLAAKIADRLAVQLDLVGRELIITAKVTHAL